MKKKRIFNIAWTVIIYACILAAFIFCNIHFNKQLKSDAPVWEYYVWVVIESFGLLIIGLLYSNAIFLQTRGVNEWSEKIIYSLITINPFWLIDNLLEAKHHGLFSWKVKRWITIDYPLIAMAIAIYIILVLIDKLAIPQVPIVFISLSLEFIAVFFVAWITQSFLKTLVTGFLCGLFLLALPTTYFINFAQFCFDYLFDNMVVAFAAFVIVKKKDSKNPFKWISFFTIPFVLIFWCRVISGVAFYSSFDWKGFPLFLYSVVVNALNTFVDYIVMMILGPIIFSRLYVLKDKYDAKFKIRKTRI